MSVYRFSPARTEPARRRHAALRRIHAAPRHRPASAIPWTPLLTAVCIGLGAALIRLIGITRSYDIFIDETTYAAIARDTTWATGPMLAGAPFVLHPPLAFLLLALPVHALGTQDLTALIFGVRPVVALIGSVVPAVLYLALATSGLRRAAIVAAALVAVDPFVISFDSRVMLEAVAQMFAALTVAGAIAVSSSRSTHRWRWAVMTAVAGAATFGTKETFGLVVLGTLILVAGTSRPESRRPMIVATGGTVVGYALVNLLMIHWAGLSLWWHLRTDGLSRLVGIKQSTGFKASGVRISFWDRTLHNIADLSPTGLILAAGGVCAIVVLVVMIRRTRGAVSRIALPVSARLGRRSTFVAASGTLGPGFGPRDPDAAIRIIAVWAACACGYVTYAIVFGSLEEQMFYIAVAPCAAALAILASGVRRTALRRVVTATVVVLLGIQAAAWIQVRVEPDDVYARMLGRIHSVAPDGSTVAVTEETAQFLLSGYRLGQWNSIAELRANRVDFVLVSRRLVQQGYGLADQNFADAVAKNGSLVLDVTGRAHDLELYDVRGWTGAASTTAGASGTGS